MGSQSAFHVGFAGAKDKEKLSLLLGLIEVPHTHMHRYILSIVQKADSCWTV